MWGRVGVHLCWICRSGESCQPCIFLAKYEKRIWKNATHRHSAEFLMECVWVCMRLKRNAKKTFFGHIKCCHASQSPHWLKRTACHESLVFYSWLDWFVHSATSRWPFLVLPLRAAKSWWNGLGSKLQRQSWVRILRMRRMRLAHC